MGREAQEVEKEMGQGEGQKIQRPTHEEGKLMRPPIQSRQIKAANTFNHNQSHLGLTIYHLQVARYIVLSLLYNGRRDITGGRGQMLPLTPPLTTR